jgi:hypothetical protein
MCQVRNASDSRALVSRARARLEIIRNSCLMEGHLLVHMIATHAELQFGTGLVVDGRDS